MINFVRMVLAVAFPLSLQACAGSVRTHVTRVHNLPIDLTGRTFALMPFASQSGRLEYQDYANEMATYLIAHGLAPTGNIAESDYVAVITYENGNQQAVGSQIPASGQAGRGTQNAVARPAFGVGRSREIEVTMPVGYGPMGGPISQPQRLFAIPQAAIGR